MGMALFHQTVLGWLRSIFGGKLNNITNAVAVFAGIKSSSASAALSMAAIGR